MMNKLFLLTKVLIKNSFSFGNFKNDKARRRAIFGILALIVFVIFSCCLPIVAFLNEILKYAAIEKIIISAIIPFAGIATIVFSVFSLVSVFYINKEGDVLLTMPFKSKEIFMAKFLTALITEYYLLLLFVFPCLIGIGVGINAGILYYVYAILVFALIPIIPSCIVTFFVLIITRVFGVLKNKDTFVYLSMAFMLLFAFGYDYFVIKFANMEDAAYLVNSVSSLENGVIPTLKKLFPFYNSASSSLIEYNNINGLFSFMTFLAINLVSLVILSFVGDKMYLRGITNSKGNNSNNEKREIKFKESKNTITSNLLKKDWLMIKRTPVYMINLVVVSFLMPIVFCFSFFMGLTEETVFELNIINKYIDQPFVYLAIVAFLTLLTCGSVGAATSISREGSNAYVMKTIPVSYFKQINIKVFLSSMLDIAGSGLFFIIISLIFKIPFYYFILCIVPLILIDFILNYGSIFVDLKRPKINWSEESAAVKSNLNSFYSMLLSFGMCIVLGLGAYFLYDVEMNVIVLSLILIVVLTLILSIIVYLFYKKSDSLLDKVD